MSHYVALTTLTGLVRPHELTEAATALQTQVLRDFLPEWGVSATVFAASFDAIPAGSIPIIVHDGLTDTAANGYHRTRRDDTPYIIVPYGLNWPLAASHELLRMLANPSGSARVPGPSPMRGQGTVEYFLDVCAPCQDVGAAYAINAVTVSDFCTRGFFAMSGTGGSHTGAVRKAFEPVTNGLVTWLADDDLLYQARADRMGRIQTHGGFSSANRGHMLLSELVNLLTPDRLRRLSNSPRAAHLLEAEQDARRVHVTNMMRFRDDIVWRFGEAVERSGERSRDPRRMDAVVFANTALPIQSVVDASTTTMRNVT
jgi:hypothetical protein